MSLDDKVKQLSAKKEEAAFDKDAERKLWFQELYALHDSIKNWLGRFVQDGSLEIEFVQTRVDDGELGVYSAPVMLLKFRGKTVKLQPVGSMIVGWRGYVDIYAPAGGSNSSLRLDPARDRSTWMLVSQNNQLRVVLTQQTFEKHLDDLL